MPRFEYKVVPAPNRGLRVKGVKRAEDRFALALANTMNQFGAEGWDYIRADILPTEERSGLASKQTVYHNMLIFRRELPDDVGESELPALEETETPLTLAAPDELEGTWVDAPEEVAEDQPEDAPASQEEPRRDAAAE